MSEDKLLQIQELIDSASASLKTANALMRDLTGVIDTDKERHVARASATTSAASSSTEGKVVEGIFDGQNMMDGEGQSYPVPANYASKSKLVEGDGMKLTITDEGKFIYKQISPINRKTVMGVLIQEDGQYKILADGKVYRVLLASVTFYRAEVGDQVTILVPSDIEATWGAIEAVIPKHVADAATKESVGAESSEDGELSPAME
ncbi:MAG: hypothetical protein QF793_00050 [Candidatus Peribacteraceae bacterium]|jgi:hypothetical protein|nr:hypothetical protein [bacterium]MDP6561299.1 hypothetical protein [Candidatus Peribacteraceae bacterium]|tara:strand:- start:4503 stop:5117 length:615 start_codon:yes stop_codon:yes gene_type:complete